jgi:hypothetical protein
MHEKRPNKETLFEASLRSAIMKTGRTFDDLEKTSGVSSQAIGRFVSGMRGLTSWTAGRLMEELNLVVLCVEYHEKLGKKTVSYSHIEMVDRPAPRPRGRPVKVADRESSDVLVEAKHREAKVNRGGVPEEGESSGTFDLKITKKAVKGVKGLTRPKRRGRPPKDSRG